MPTPHSEQQQDVDPLTIDETSPVIALNGGQTQTTLSPDPSPVPQPSAGAPGNPFSASGIRPTPPLPTRPPEQLSPGRLVAPPGGPPPSAFTTGNAAPAQPLNGSRDNSFGASGIRPLSPALIQRSPGMPQPAGGATTSANRHSGGLHPPNGPALSQFSPSYQPGRPALTSGSLRERGQVRTQRRVVVAVASLLIIILLALSGTYLLPRITGQQTQTHPPTSTPRPRVVATLPPLTASNPQDLYNQARNRPALLSDPLHQQSANNWQAVNTTGTCTFSANALNVSDTGTGLLTVCLAEATTFKNFAFQAQVRIQQGDTAGLVFRADPLGHQQYLFGITTDGQYTLSYINEPGDTQIHLLAGGSSPAIKQGTQSNQLTVIAQNATLSLFINDQFIQQVNDTTYTGGAIGLFAGNSQGNTSTALFNNASVWGV